MEERINEKIKELLENYKENEYVLNRLENYICNILPVALEKAKQENEKRTKIIFLLLILAPLHL